MLKPYDKRVQSTYDFMVHLFDIVQRDHQQIGELKHKADEAVKKQAKFDMNWDLDTEHVDTITFKGYAALRKPSEISGLSRLYYDRSKPWVKTIKYYDNYKVTLQVEKPKAYIIPQAWGKIIDLYKLNNVAMRQLAHDTTVDVQMYYIGDFKNPTRPYEGHYLHTAVKVNPTEQKVKFYAGDYVVYTDQALNRYIVETLEPQGVDSFFAWNFFDSILGQKEGYSDYVFEDIAAEWLKKNPDVRKRLDEEKAKNPTLANSGRAQLNWVYQNSPFYEKTYQRYPVARVQTDIKFDFVK